MTRKDFEVIAAVVRETATTAVERKLWTTTFANVFDACYGYPKFNRRKFVQACFKEPSK